MVWLKLAFRGSSPFLWSSVLNHLACDQVTGSCEACSSGGLNSTLAISSLLEAEASGYESYHSNSCQRGQLLMVPRVTLCAAGEVGPCSGTSDKPRKSSGGKVTSAPVKIMKVVSAHIRSKVEPRKSGNQCRSLL